MAKRRKGPKMRSCMVKPHTRAGKRIGAYKRKYPTPHRK